MSLTVKLPLCLKEDACKDTANKKNYFPELNCYGFVKRFDIALRKNLFFILE